jgi:UDP-N-acetyl-D-glucosamine dehydrogenase
MEIRAMSRLEELRDRIESREARIGVIGLGYVGLPLALEFSKAGFEVVGFDIDAEKVASVQEGRSYIEDVPGEELAEARSSGKLGASTDFAGLAGLDVINICVPTPLTRTKDPDVSHMAKALEEIRRRLRSGQLVILGSTTYPGTTDEMLLPRLETDELKVGRDFFLAYSPEREDPGNKKFGAGNTPKVVGGITGACLETASALYNSITRAVPVSSTRAAELTKLLENTYRAVNIALVNEIKILAHKMGIDLFEVINAAATKPFGYKPFYPGPGLGGHCIPIDPFYLAWKAKEYDFSARFIHLAGEINVAMPYYVVEKTADALNQHRKSLNGSRILVLGIAYKKDIDDDRESPGYAIMDMLMKKGAEVCYNDPWVPTLKPTRKYDFKLQSEALTPAFLEQQDAAIIVTDHSDYDIAQIVEHSKIIVDTRNATAGITTGKEKVVMA